MRQLHAELYDLTSLITMAHAPETGAVNRLRFLAPVFGAGFSYHVRLE